MAKSRRNVLIAALLLIVLAAFAASSFLFVAQGGVGAGHMRFDQVIGLLGLPWLWVLELIPWTESLWLGDYVMVVLVSVRAQPRRRPRSLGTAQAKTLRIETRSSVAR